MIKIDGFSVNINTGMVIVRGFQGLVGVKEWRIPYQNKIELDDIQNDCLPAATSSGFDCERLDLIDMDMNSRATR